MSIQDKLASFHIGLKRSLFDFNVSSIGTELQIIRLKTVEGKFGDEEITIVNEGTLTVNLDLPDEIPLTRLRSDVTKEVASTSNNFIYDILPIEGYAKIEDNVEERDIIIVKIFSDIDNTFFVLQVTETLGNIKDRYMSWKKFQCAPYVKALTQDVQDIIDEYLSC